MQSPEDRPAPQPSPWAVYMVRCRDGSYYTGISTSLPRRIAEHNSPRGGAKYTRSRRPVTLVYSETASNRAMAARREYQIRKMSVCGKSRLISQATAPDADPCASVHTQDRPEGSEL